MKFLLHKNAGSSAVRRIGDYLRAHGAGRHWLERYRGDVFLFASDPRDELILRTKFAEFLDEIDDVETGEAPR
jgi:hypothetical protein